MKNALYDMIHKFTNKTFSIKTTMVELAILVLKNKPKIYRGLPYILGATLYTLF